MRHSAISVVEAVAEVWRSTTASHVLKTKNKKILPNLGQHKLKTDVVLTRLTQVLPRAAARITTALVSNEVRKNQKPATATVVMEEEKTPTLSSRKTSGDSRGL